MAAAAGRNNMPCRRAGAMVRGLDAMLFALRSRGL
jgi:hypothetical protein